MSLSLGIVTISYNQAPFLKEAISSVSLQDPSNLKYVIVDPGSTDGSREIIREHEHKFYRTILEPDKGPSDGLNRGFEACDADILGYLNADDYFRPGALDWVHRFMTEHPEIEAILGAVAIADEQGNEQFRRRIAWGFTPQNYLDEAGYYVQQGTFFRRSAWERAQGFRVENRSCWDTELAIDLALTGTRFHQVRKCLGVFRVYAASITGSQWGGTDGVMAAKMSVDEAIIREKIQSAGFVKTPPPLGGLKRLASKWSPVRRFFEMSSR